MRIFKSLSAWLRNITHPQPQAQTDPLRPKLLANFGLKESDLSNLAGLTQSPAWDSYVRALDTATMLVGEGILTADSAERLFELRGTVLGMRRAVSLPTEILRKAKELTETDARIAKSRLHTDDPRTIATFGTPGWTRNGGTTR